MEAEEEKKYQKRTITMEFRVTEEEKKMIEQRAEEANCTFSFYARAMLMHGYFYNITDEEKKLLRGIGFNINQIAKRVNSGAGNPADLLKSTELLLKMIEPFYKKNASRKSRKNK